MVLPTSRTATFAAALAAAAFAAAAVALATATLTATTIALAAASLATASLATASLAPQPRSSAAKTPGGHPCGGDGAAVPRCARAAHRSGVRSTAGHQLPLSPQPAPPQPAASWQLRCRCCW